MSSPPPPFTTKSGVDNSGLAAPPWEPDWLDRFLRCGPGGPHNRALTGFVLLRVIFAVILTHSGVVFAGVLTYQAIKLTDCLEDDDSSDGSCGSDGDDISNDASPETCRRLWGILKPDSLLTVIATGAAVVLALSSIFVGTLMDVTPHRKQIGMFFTCMCIFGDLFCLAILGDDERSIAIASAGLFVTYVFKNYHFMLIESYAPELSHKHDEVSKALSVAGVWMYSTQVSTIILWVIFSLFGFSDAAYGFVVTIGTIVIMAVLIPVCFARLPNTPARDIEEMQSSTLFAHSLSRQKLMFLDLYYNYYDLGIYYVANAIFDPALLALFVAAIQVLVSKYKFTSDQIPIIIGIAIVSAVFGAFIPRYIVTYYRQQHDQASEGGGEEEGYEPLLDAVHPSVYKYLIIADLLLLSGITLCATYFLQPCNVGLACVFGVLWGCSLSFAWTCGNIMRSALIPGGSESEFAGILMTSTSATSWVPLFVFSIANELWTIEGGMLTLVGFFLLGEGGRGGGRVCVCALLLLLLIRYGYIVIIITIIIIIVIIITIIIMIIVIIIIIIIIILITTPIFIFLTTN
jgi:hypothetical protein